MKTAEAVLRTLHKVKKGRDEIFAKLRWGSHYIKFGNHG